LGSDTAGAARVKHLLAAYLRKAVTFGERLSINTVVARLDRAIQ